ncbi:MAG: hypothetical protein PW789_00200 [Edaphobacter sp.]|uniref:hypothetical protein n=1 Tax=Edaphobacter sp. TaxID=1934404 RepID=UPI00238A3F47|nr:hypothetical protein [Edaphobacter sp.]MDE1175012.1 hypothetical protein [Edaphobacter sp.]
MRINSSGWHTPQIEGVIMTRRWIQIAFLLIAVVSACTAGATTYYVSPTGNNLYPGTSTTQPWKTIAKVNSTTFSSGDQILFLRGGTWREMLTPKSSGIYLGAYGTGSRPIITGANLVTTGWTQVTTKVWSYSLGSYAPTEVWFNAVLGKQVATSSTIIGPGQWAYASSKLYVYSTANPSTAYSAPGIEVTQRDRSLLVQNVGNITVEHLGFVNATYTCIYLATGVTGYQTFNDVVWQGAPYEGFRVDSGSPSITNSKGLYNATGLGVGGGGGITMSNSILSGNIDDAIEIYGTTGISVIDSSTITGNSTSAATWNTISNWSSYALQIGNSVILPNPFDPKTFTYVGVTDLGTNVYQSPEFQARAAPLFILPFVDDYNNLGVAEQVAAMAQNYGCHISYAVNTKLVTPADWSRIAALAAAGNEIVAHTRSHADIANNNVFTMSYLGTAATATMSINQAAGTVTTYLNGQATPDLNVPLLDSYNSMLNVCTQINANPSYSCVIQDNQNFFTPLMLADVSQANIKSPYLAQASSGFLNFEINGSIADIQANIPGYVVKSFATPFTSSNITTENQMHAAGVLANRNGIFTPDYTPNGNWLLSGLDIYNIGAEWLPDGYDATKPAASIGALAEGLGAAGGVLSVYSHGYDEFSLSQWQQLFATLQNVHATCATMSQASSYIMSQGSLLPDGTGRNWVVNVPLQPNYATTTDSPAQGAHNLLP